MKWSILSLLLILSFHQAQPFIIAAISAIYSIYQVINDAHDTYSKLTTPSTADLMDEILNIKDSVNQVTKEVSQKIDALYEQLIEQLPRLGQIHRGLETFSLRFNRISYLYKNFERLIRKKEPSERILKEFSTVALSFFSDSVSATLDALHELFIPTEVGHLSDGLLGLLAKNLEGQTSDNDTLACSAGTPPEEQLYLLYTALVTAEIRGFMMMTFTYILLETYSGETYEIEIENSRTSTLVRIQEYLWELANIIQWSSRTFYECDPPDGYIKHRTYGEFEMFLSFYIVNQYSIYRNCQDYCSSVSGLSKGWVHCAEKDQICDNVMKCTGQIVNCYRFPNEGGFACNNRAAYVGSQRYLYYWDGSANGYKANCSAGGTFEMKSFQGQNSENKWYTCDYCGCICVLDKFSSKNVYAVSFRPQIADIENNKVLSGIKFTMTSPQMLHLQIQHGEIRTDSIAVDTVEWKPLETMKIDQYKDWDENDPTPTIYDENRNKYKAEVDFGQLTWENRDIYFDELIAPNGYIVTGARLNRALNDEKAIQLEIHVTPYDFGKGKLIISDDQPSIWIKPLNMRAVTPAYNSLLRERVGKSGKGPMKSYRRTKVISKPYSWIRINLSNAEDDASGTVYPLVDLRNVTTPNPFLLEGVGLIYKEPVDDNEIGYMAFSLRAMNRGKFFALDITIDDLELDENTVEALAPPEKNAKKNKK